MVVKLGSVLKKQVGESQKNAFLFKKKGSKKAQHNGVLILMHFSLVEFFVLLFLFLDFFSAGFQATFSHQERPH